MKLEPYDQVPLRVLRDVLREHATRRDGILTVSANAALAVMIDALDTTLGASSAATRASDGQGAETRPSSAVPEAAAEPPAKGERRTGEGCGCLLCQTQATLDRVVAERDQSLDDLAFSREETRAVLMDFEAWRRRTVKLKRDAAVADLARVTAERNEALAKAKRCGCCGASMPCGGCAEDCDCGETEVVELRKIAEILDVEGDSPLEGVRNLMGDLQDLRTERDDTKCLTIREAARRRLTLEGPSAQALEGALAQAERELSAIKAERGEWADGQAALFGQLAEAQAEVANLKAVNRYQRGFHDGQEPEAICPNCDSWNVSVVKQEPASPALAVGVGAGDRTAEGGRE